MGSWKERLGSIVSGYGLFGIGREALPPPPPPILGGDGLGWRPEVVWTRPAPQPITREQWMRAGMLFALTFASTWLTVNWQYSLAIMTILLCHEMGHYLTCRHYRVSASLPYFVPLPFVSLFGTMGAIIRMRGTIRDRRVLFDIGIAGPLAGLVPALIALVWGLKLSSVVHTQSVPNMIPLGDSLMLRGLEHFFFPGLAESDDVLLHPLAFAGWAGLFVTALNLLPVGQLDGGHVLYGLAGKRSATIATLVLAAMALNAVFYPGWWFWVALLAIFGVRHPRTLDEHVPIGAWRVALGVFALIVFVLCFVPQPFNLH
ncbi:MAG: site-2 protease family protein [Candidatus Eisenbacteria bacterium]